jgi:hypothetical protein
VVTGWWFFHAGVTKLLEDGLAYTYGPMSLQNREGTALGGLPVWMGNNLAWLIEPGVALFETLIGLALILGVFTRLVAVADEFDGAGTAVFPDGHRACRGTPLRPRPHHRADERRPEPPAAAVPPRRRGDGE